MGCAEEGKPCLSGPGRQEALSIGHDLDLDSYDYDLPPGQIAQEPAEPRDSCRLLVLHRQDGSIEHRIFRDIGEYLGPGDLLVLNDTRVIPARIFGRRSGGGLAEVLLLHEVRPGVWEALVRPGKRIRPGDRLHFDDRLQADVLERTESGGRLLEFHCRGSFLSLLEELGQTPLPPYIKRSLADPESYQTVYSRRAGSAAAPTAGLHFTPEMLERLQGSGVRMAWLTLHIGLDTFRPLRHRHVVEHRMHSEYFQVPEETRKAVAEARREGRRIVSVGTTATRALEAAFSSTEPVSAGWTDLYIYPGYEFNVVDVMLTNFHLPRTSLLLLVSAFAGRENVMNAYHEAVSEGYRFFSFGDAMLII